MKVSESTIGIGKIFMDKDFTEEKKTEERK